MCPFVGDNGSQPRGCLASVAPVSAVLIRAACQAGVLSDGGSIVGTRMEVIVMYPDKHSPPFSLIGLFVVFLNAPAHR